MQFIDISQLHNNTHHPNVVSTGLGLSFGDQQQLHQQHVCYTSPFLYVITDDYATQMKEQRDKLEQFFQAQVFIFFFA